jgi:hypothetical protein
VCRTRPSTSPSTCRAEARSDASCIRRFAGAGRCASPRTDEGQGQDPHPRDGHDLGAACRGRRPSGARPLGEGDLIVGSKKTVIGKLVERTTRFVMLMKLDSMAADVVTRCARLSSASPATHR